MVEPTSLSWRNDETAGTGALPRQGGISPKKFHANSSNRRPRQQKHLNKVLQDSADSVIRQQRKQVNTLVKLKRAAYKEVTSLKTWPLQELALKDLDHWTMIHLGKHVPLPQQLSPTTAATEIPDVETHGDSTGLSSSSLEEPKRTRRKDSDDEEDLSPRKSTQRHQFKHEFIRERNRPALFTSDDDDDREHDNVEKVNFQDAANDDDSNNNSILPALWCMEPRIFSVEKSATGKRKYMVGHLGRFLDYYWRKVDPNQRHYYELIREKTPCRLYLDLEFAKKANPDITEEDSDQLMDEFLQELIVEFESRYDLHVTKADMVDLDSSTEKKFSRHIIVHLPGGALFADAVAVGRFVRVFVGRLADEVATGTMKDNRPALAKHLFVNSAPSKSTTNTQEISKTCFVDLGVYTRNRLFRLLGSTKFGKAPTAALRIAPTNQFPLSIANESFYAPAIAESNKEPESSTPESLNDDMTKFMSSVDWTAHAEALAATLVVPMNVSKCNFPILPDSEEAQAALDEDGGNKTSASLALFVATSTTRSSSTTVKAGKSLFPFLDKFVLNKLATRGGVQGSIRGWSVDYHENSNQKLCKSITYQMSRNRWCQAIGRPHKSNNIMWTIDFTTMEATQGCHDPECRSILRGQQRGTVPLPHNVQEELRDVLFEQELARVTDEAETMRVTGDIKQSPASQGEFDDAEFERALLALKINGDDTPKKSNKVVDEDPGIDDTAGEFDDIGNQKGEFDEAALDDDALWNAALDNPELFP